MEKSDFLLFIHALLLRLIHASPIGATVRPPKFLTSLYIHTMFFDPDRPSRILPFRFFRIDFRAVKNVVICISPISDRLDLTGLNVPQGCGSPMVYIILCVRFTIIVTDNSTTLDNGGWLNLSIQGLSPCQ